MTVNYKKITIIALIFGIILCSIVFFTIRKNKKITNYPPSGNTIIAFGDSLVKGVGSTNGNDFVTLLSKQSGEPIINMGISGNTSIDGLNRIDTVNIKDPKIVLLLLGGNDFLRKVPLEQTFKNIDDIVISLQKNGAVVILLGVPSGILLDQYDENFEKIAKSRGTLYVPNVLSGILGHVEYMSDAIHPNDLGYKKIADKIYPVLKKSLK